MEKYASTVDPKQTKGNSLKTNGRRQKWILETKNGRQEIQKRKKKTRKDFEFCAT